MCCFCVHEAYAALPDPYKKCLDMALGRYAVATAGHDVGSKYIIVGIDETGRVLLCDGRLRGVGKPKAKKLRHVRIIDGRDEDIASRIKCGKTVRDADIIRSIRLNCPN